MKWFSDYQTLLKFTSKLRKSRNFFASLIDSMEDKWNHRWGIIRTIKHNACLPYLPTDTFSLWTQFKSSLDKKKYLKQSPSTYNQGSFEMSRLELTTNQLKDFDQLSVLRLLKESGTLWKRFLIETRFIHFKSDLIF